MLTRFSDLDRTFAYMDQVRRRMDRAFDEAEQARAHEELWGRSRLPRMTLADAGESLVIKAEVPGFGDKDVQLSIQKEVLTMSGERKQDVPEGYFVHRQERAPVKFARSFALPCKVDPEKSTATITNGVLTVTLAKAPEAQPRQIAIKVQ